MGTIKKLSMVFFLLLLTAVVIGCSADASADDIRTKSDTYRGEFVDGDPQHRSYIFTGLSGYHQEMLTVDSSKNLSVRLELAFGELQVFLFSPSGKEVLSVIIKPGVADSLEIIGPMEAGTYTMVLEGQRADGRVQLFFKK